MIDVLIYIFCSSDSELQKHCFNMIVPMRDLMREKF